MISKYKIAKHFAVTITDTTLTIEPRQDQIDAEATLDGFYDRGAGGSLVGATRAEEHVETAVRPTRGPANLHVVIELLSQGQ